MDKNSIQSSRLSEREAYFVQFFVHDNLSVMAAMKAAGYETHKKCIHNPLSFERVRRAVALERQKYAQASDMTRRRVVDGILEAIDMAKAKQDPAVMISGWKEVAKICGLNEPQKVQIDINASVTTEHLRSLSDAELARLLAESEAIEGELVDSAIAQLEASEYVIQDPADE